MMPEELRIGEDNICPVTKSPCDDECCPPGAICNISGSGSLSPAHKFAPGDFVHYIPLIGSMENGRIKSIHGNTAFVVYHCNDEWSHYQEYTGCGTYISELRPGWIDGDEPKS